ncbi:MAG: putative ATPase [Colwellia sp.]|jgi:predicted ATPase
MIIRTALLDRKRYQLAPDVINNNKNLFTVIIGINGAGKSRLLSKISDTIIRVQPNNFGVDDELPKALAKQIDAYDKGQYFSIYSRANARYSYLGSENRSGIDKSFNTKLISVTTSPFDKFPVISKRTSTFKYHDDDRYHYIGLRVSENSYNKSNFLNLLTRSFLKNGVNTKQKQVLDLLGYSLPVTLSFKDKVCVYSWDVLKFKEGNLSKEDKRAKFLSFLSKNSPTLYANIASKGAELVDEVSDAYFKEHSYISKSCSVGVDFETNKNLRLLLDVGVIQVDDIIMGRKERKVSIGDASSGETCILLTILNIAGVIKNNSVICIDEPEISLHPEWQKNFMSLLISTFENFKGCHFIISTHSPTVISELSEENCYILAMNEKGGEFQSSENFKNKSADYQLAELFDAPGSNNEYLNRVVVSLLTSLSKNGKLNKEERKEAKKLVLLSQKLEEDDDVKSLIGILELGLEKTKK